MTMRTCDPGVRVKLFVLTAAGLSFLWAPSVLASPAQAQTLIAGQEALRMARETYGADSAETVVSLMNLARINKEQGDHQQAVLLYRQSGAMAEKISDPEDPFLLAIFNGLASAYEAMRKYASADAIYEEVRRRGHLGWADQMEFRADTMRQA